MLSRRALAQHVLRGRTVLAAAALAVMIGSAPPAAAQWTDLPGNLFQQYNAPQYPYTTGVAINNPQDMGGGNWSAAALPTILSAEIARS